MKSSFARPIAAATVALMMVSACGARGDDSSSSPGITDTEIRIGISRPQSGPMALYGQSADAMRAVFDSVNAAGGIDGRKIKFISYDDGFEPARTLENTRRLVEKDKVFATIGAIATQPNLAIKDYVNQNKVPALFMGAGASALADVDKSPWTVPALPSYILEGKLLGLHIAEKDPKATVSILMRDDDGGRDFVNGLKSGIAGTDVKLVAEQSADPTSATVESQMVNLAESKSDWFVNMNNSKQATQAITFINDSSWRPKQYLVATGASIEATLEPAGLDKSKGILTTQYYKDPLDPSLKGDSGFENYMKVMGEFAPNSNPNDVNVSVSGYAIGQMLVEALKGMKEPTREGLMKSIDSMSGYQSDMHIDGIKVTMSAKDHWPIECLRFAEFDGTEFAPAGEVQCDE